MLFTGFFSLPLHRDIMGKKRRTKRKKQKVKIEDEEISFISFRYLYQTFHF